jgi:LacI family transcriptional regulator
VSRVRLRDVASRAGVALSTASAALSGSPRVSDPTRARVLDAARVLEYDGPDPWARALRTRQPGIICLVLDSRPVGRDCAQVLRLMTDVADAAANHDSHVLLISYGGVGATQQIWDIPAAAALVVGRASSALAADLAGLAIDYLEIPLHSDRTQVDRLVQILHDSRTPQRNPGRDPNRTDTGPHGPAESL